MELMAQDKIILKTGDTLHVVISQRDDKSVSYHAYDDPELNTQSLPTDQITKIQLNNGKIIDFKKSNKYPGAYVGIYAGNAIPFSDFAHAEANDERSGFARDKPFISIEGRMRVFRFIGVQADIGLGTFGVNSSPYMDYENQRYNMHGITVDGTLNNYRYSTFSIGPDLGFNLGKRFKVFLPIQFSAISISTSGEDQINYTNAGTTNSVYRTSSGLGFGGTMGVKLDLMIGKHIGVGLSGKAQAYDVEMDVQERYTEGTNIDYSWTQSVSYFYVGLNLHYHFK
ncbi:MAG: hypothetical protein K0R51_3270 [Cytophagaceae bacterium]|jgi:hypothetical protein|nr:hypothetical protein [Cytophagaceae bacterium]